MCSETDYGKVFYDNLIRIRILSHMESKKISVFYDNVIRIRIALNTFGIYSCYKSDMCSRSGYL